MTEEIIRNIWFYGLSTIAQTCAAILTLGGTFVVYKLVKVQEGISNYKGRVVRILTYIIENTFEYQYYDVTGEKVLASYENEMEKIKYINKEPHPLKSLYQMISDYERIPIQVIRNQWDIKGVKAWCTAMAKHLRSNIKTRNNIYFLFRNATMLLSFSIVSSMILLLINPVDYITMFIGVMVVGVVAVLFSAMSVWVIASSKEII